MADFLEQLAQVEVPAPPAQFDRQLHQRVNRSLLLQHLFDLVVRGLPWAMLQMLGALGAVVTVGISGRFSGERPPPRPDSPDAV
jgi:hypothetical protein